MRTPLFDQKPKDLPKGKAFFKATAMFNRVAFKDFGIFCKSYEGLHYDHYRAILLSLDGEIEVGGFEIDKKHDNCFLTIKETESREFHRTKSTNEAIDYFDKLTFLVSKEKDGITFKVLRD